MVGGSGYATSVASYSISYSPLPVTLGMRGGVSLSPISAIFQVRVRWMVFQVLLGRVARVWLRVLNLSGVKSYTSNQLLFQGCVLAASICASSCVQLKLGKLAKVMPLLLSMMGWESQLRAKRQSVQSLTLNCWVVQTTVVAWQSRTKTLDSQAATKTVQYLHWSMYTQAAVSKSRMLHYQQSDIWNCCICSSPGPRCMLSNQPFSKRKSSLRSFLRTNIIYNMLNALSGGSSLPREVLQWIDTLDLSYAIRNPRIDLANGFLVAEILTRRFPAELSILTFYNAQRKDHKIDNWQQIQKCKFELRNRSKAVFLAKKKFKIPKEEYESITNLGPETAQTLLFRLYQFLTGNKLNTDRRLASTLPPAEEPLYKKPTASYAAKDRELHRVVDDNEKMARTLAAINQQKSMIHTQKYNTGLIEWLIEKRKDEIEKEVTRQKEEIEKRTKSFANTESKIEVREIELKCFNSSTSKKVKGDYGDFGESKGVLDFLSESAALLVKKESIANDLKKFGIEIKEKDVSGINLVVQIFGRCDEQDSKGNRKITADTLNRLLQLFKKTSEVNLIVENIHNNFIDYRKFFRLLQKPLLIYDKDSETHKLVVAVLGLVARSLLKSDAESAEMLFLEVLLPELLKVGENEFKRPLVANLILEFVRKESECYFSLVQRIKELCAGNIRSYVALLAHLLERIARECEDIQYTLWSEFFYYGFLAINNPAPSVRSHGAKVLARLFSDVVVANNEVVGEKLPALQGLVSDPWWEVRAQGLVIFKAILLSKYKNQSSSTDINEDLNTKTILHYISQVFKVDVSHNILRIGLIELAELIVYEEGLCERYLQILLHVGPQIRADVLNTNVIKFGPVVYGANTFTYKLTGAPLVWNSLGIARVLAQYVKRERVQGLSKAHLEILLAAVSKSGNFIENYPEWLRIYQEFKEKIFRTLLNDDLCVLGLSIIKEFMETEQIHGDVIAASKSEIAKILSSVYVDANEGEVKSNLLELFKYLMHSESEYTYKIIKDFAEREKTKYLSSNLVDFMNDLTRERRKRLFNE